MENSFIPLSTPNFRGNEKKYVDEAVDGEWASTCAYGTSASQRETWCWFRP